MVNIKGHLDIPYSLQNGTYCAICYHFPVSRKILEAGDSASEQAKQQRK
jgi:hypothetical protein